MNTIKPLLIETLELMLEVWRDELNREYARRDSEQPGTPLFDARDYLLQKRVRAVKSLDKLIAELKSAV